MRSALKNLTVNKTSVFFPVENLTRELDFRLLMAVLAARPNRRIFVGHPWRFQPIYGVVEEGIYVGKTFLNPSTPRSDLRGYERLKRQNISVILLEEEGAVFPGDEDSWRSYLDHRLDPSIFQEDDVVLTWGEFQASHYRERCPEMAERILSTGHPRFDIYKPHYREFFDQQVAKLREKHGRFILINTSSGLGNHSMGDDFVFKNIYERGEDHPDWQMSQIQLWSDQKIQLANFIRLIYRLAKAHPDLKIISRPHPSESRTFYKTAFQGLSNVEVCHEGPVAPWIFASELVIQEACTTAIETYLADKPLITYNSVTDPKKAQRLPKLFGVLSDTPEEVVQFTEEILSGKRNGLVQRLDEDPNAKSMLRNFEADSLELILETLDQVEEAKRRRSTRAPALLQTQVIERAETIQARIKKPLRRLSPSKQHAYESLKGQFAGFDEDEITRKLDTIQSMTGQKVDYTIMSPWLIVFDGVRT